MKSLVETITDALLEMRIVEQAMARKELRRRVSDLGDQIAHHVLKVALYPEHNARNHWESEIDSWVAKITQHKMDGNKRLSPEGYAELLYKPHFEGVSATKDAEAIYPKAYKLPVQKRTDSEHDALASKIKSFYNQLTSNLASGNYENSSDLFKSNSI